MGTGAVDAGKHPPILVTLVCWQEAEYLPQTLNSFLETTQSEAAQGLYNLHIVQNGEGNPALTDCLRQFSSTPEGRGRVHFLPQNYGHIVATNYLVHKYRQPNQWWMKVDPDIIWNKAGWLTQLYDAMQANPDFGNVGLKRWDVPEHPFHNHVATRYHRRLPYILEESRMVMGNCHLVNGAVMDAVRYLAPELNNAGGLWLYGFDDAITTHKVRMLGWKNAYLLGTITDIADAVDRVSGWAGVVGQRPPASGVTAAQYEAALVANAPDIAEALYQYGARYLKRSDAAVLALGHAGHMTLPVGLTSIDRATDQEYLQWKHQFAGQHLSEFHQRCVDYTEGRRPLQETTLWTEQTHPVFGSPRP